MISPFFEILLQKRSFLNCDSGIDYEFPSFTHVFERTDLLVSFDGVLSINPSPADPEITIKEIRYA